MEGKNIPRNRAGRMARIWGGCAILAFLMTGCTTLREYLDNGCKVGPNYARPPAAVANKWIDQSDSRIKLDPEEHRCWWKTFQDPVLDDLICAGFQQNLVLREASFRVLELRAILGTIIGRIFPQEQVAVGGYQRVALSRAIANRQFIPDRFYSNWMDGLGMSWELDFWGKYRRNIESFEAEMDAGIEFYDDHLVKTLADIAAAYTRYRIFERQIELVKSNVRLQEETLKIARARFRGGLVSELDVDQSESILQQTMALIPQMEIDQRIAQNQLCVLLGIPTEDLAPRLGKQGIPTAPPEVILGVPADLIRRRPDVRRMEREAAARCARIGVAESEFYPAISITGEFGYQAQFFPTLFDSQALYGTIGPSFRWRVLNYGRIANDVLRTEAIFQQAVLRYQQSVLVANQQVEDAVVRFLKNQVRARELAKSVDAAEKAVKIAIAQYRAGQVDFNRVSLIEQNLVQQQVLWTASLGDISLGLIQVYQALGGGWQIRLDGCQVTGARGSESSPTSPLPLPKDMDPKAAPLTEPEKNNPASTPSNNQGANNPSKNDPKKDDADKKNDPDSSNLPADRLPTPGKLENLPPLSGPSESSASRSMLPVRKIVSQRP